MIPHSPAAELFKRHFQNSLNREIKNSRTVKFAKHTNIYSCGDESENIYFIKSGQVKLVTLSPAGKECLLAIYIPGDIFGELCLSDSSECMETATTMEDSLIKVIPRSEFFMHLTGESLLESFVKYLTVRLADQQRIITHLVTIDSEQRLAKTLLRLAKKLGKKHPRNVIIKHKITHEELSTMVGTTRPRISQFMRKFRINNLIEMSEDNFIIVKEKNLAEYLESNGLEKFTRVRETIFEDVQY